MTTSDDKYLKIFMQDDQFGYKNVINMGPAFCMAKMH